MADRSEQHRSKRTRSSRSPSPHKHRHRSHRERSSQRHHSHRTSKSTAVNQVTLPYNSRQLSKRDYEIFKPMFASYLDIQKGKYLDEIDEAEAKGRWKSFMGKWNRGELSEGWYDPITMQKTVAASEEVDMSREERPSLEAERALSAQSSPEGRLGDVKSDTDSSDDMGPALPGQQSRSRRNRMGPSIPSMQDLELKREMAQEDGLTRRDDMRLERKLDRKSQKEQLEELVPRAEAGTRERQLEKKTEVNAKMKFFREKSPGAAEVPDSELLGGEDGISDLKKQKQDFERKKNEREVRREEVLRAKAEEREERLSVYRKKEDETMEMLKQLAKQRFG